MSEREHAVEPSQRELSIRAVVAVDPVAPSASSSSVAPIARAPSSAPNRNITKKESTTAPPATSPSCGQQPLHHQAARAGRDAPRQILRRTTRQGIKNTISPAEMSEREHAADPVNAAFDQGCRRRRPGSSTAAASSVAPIARAPASAPNRNITKKGIGDGAAGDLTIVRPAAAAPPRRPEQVEMRRAGVLGHHPPRDKEHQLASRNVGERARRRRRRTDPAKPMSSSSSVAPTARAPSSPQTRIYPTTIH